MVDNQNEPDRKRVTPTCMRGIKVLPKKEKSPYDPEDIWLEEDNALFLNYCCVSRDGCWHTMIHDASARPHEILHLKIKYVQFKVSTNGIQNAEIHVSSSKTYSRTLPLFSSIPYVKEWLEDHPFSENGEAPPFVSISKVTYGRQVSRDGM